MSTVSREAFEKQDAFGIGAPNDAYAQYFTGQSYLKPLTARGACPVFLANVTFKPAVSLTPGMVITIPAEVKHWHGAKANSWFSHIAVEVPGENTRNEWCEPVSDEVYTALG